MSDGIFNWFYGIGAEPESYSGPYDSREQAIAQAHSEDGKEHGFTICEADKSVASNDIFDAGDIFDRYEEHNEECWGEDGANMTATGPQKRDLEGMLSAALATWFYKHGTKPTPWSFGTKRNEEYFAPEKVPAE